MKRLPQKTSLVTQTAAVIREEIEAGRWTSWLPGEHELCAQLHVSRTTVRAALEELSRQQIIKSHQGRRREIIVRKSSRLKTKSNRVVILMPDPLQGMMFRAFLIDRMREHLAKEGYLLETHVSRVPFRARSAQEMEKLATMLNPAGWVLMSSPEALQKWFADRHLPCVIAGTRFHGIDLPSVDVDYGAVCHHAVGKFLSRGHQRIVLLNPHPGAAGEAVTEAGFQKAALEAKARGVEGTVVTHNGTVENIRSRLDTLMARREPPTGFLVSRARHALTVLCYMSQKGFRVPKDVAIISRDHETFLEDVIPSMARYSNKSSVLAARLSRTVIEMVHGTNRSVDYKIMSQFVPGETLG
ncbi:MAG: transcriptional regulator [Verrucomicrobiales bacterium]|nr:transcriptional regulator [Verrucomicrobiales bacterium]